MSDAQNIIQLAGVVLFNLAIQTGFAFELEKPYGTPTTNSTSYVAPIEDTLILTSAPEKTEWVEPMKSYPCIGKANIGWLIIYTDSQGIKRAGLVPWRDRMNNVTADDAGNSITIRPGTAARIEQGGILLKKDIPYPLIDEMNDQQTVLYFTGSFTQEVFVAKTSMRRFNKQVSSPKLINIEPVNAIIKQTRTSGQSTPDQSIAEASNGSLTITTSDRIYNQCTITLVEPDGLTVSHSGGVSKIPFRELPESYGKEYGYNPKKAAIYSKEMAQKRAEAASHKKSSQKEETIDGLVVIETVRNYKSPAELRKYMNHKPLPSSRNEYNSTLRLPNGMVPVRPNGMGGYEQY